MINAVDRADLSQNVLVDDDEIQFYGLTFLYNAKERELVKPLKKTAKS